MNNKSKFKLSAKKNSDQIDHLGREQIEILNQSLPRHPQQILQGMGGDRVFILVRPILRKVK